MDADAFKRADLEQLCSFILFREEKASNQISSHKERLEYRKKATYERLKSICKESEYLEVIEDLNIAFMIYEEVYTEIGMKFGARLIFQLLLKDDNIDIKNIYSKVKNS